MTNENLVNTFEAGQAYESELLLVSALVSRLPEEIRHKFDNMALGDLTVPKITDKLQIYRNRHLKAKDKINSVAIAATREECSSPEEDN